MFIGNPSSKASLNDFMGFAKVFISITRIKRGYFKISEMVKFMTWGCIRPFFCQTGAYKASRLLKRKKQ